MMGVRPVQQLYLVTKRHSFLGTFCYHAHYTLVSLTASVTPDMCACLQAGGTCELYVADRFVGWHEVTLDFLASKFDAKDKDKPFPAGWERDLIEEVRAAGEAGGMDDRRLKQTVIPFAKLKETEAKKGGAQVNAALQATLHVPCPFRAHIKL